MIIHSDSWQGYNGLVDLVYKIYFIVQHGKNEFNGIESFWGFAKIRLPKLRGIKKNSLYYHLKECEFRFYYKHKNMYLIMFKIFRNNPLS